MTDLTLDTGHRRVHARLRLHGEEAPLDLRGIYDVERDDEEDRLTIVDAVASREWLTALLRRFVVGRHFPLPPKSALALRLLA